MPKKAKELSALAVSKLKEPGRYAVGGADGLHLRVTEGSRSWVFRVQVGSTRRDLGLGAYPAVGVAEARELARTQRKLILSGEIPVAPKKEAKKKIQEVQAATRSFKECAEALITSKSSEWRNPKHRQQWENTLATYVYPTIGNLSVSSIELAHVLACLEPIWVVKTETATRIRGRIESVLSFATVRGFRSGENPARWRGHLDSILPAPGKVQKVEHHEAMPIDDVPAFMQQLAGKDGNSIRALEFLILTAARSGEVRGAHWDEFDLEKQIWTVPAGRMKAGVEHRVPLSVEAMAALKKAHAIDGSRLVFAAPRGGQLSDMALTQAMRRMALKCVPHGFRSTFRDWCGERTNYPRELAEQALAHVLGNKVEAAYRRGDALEKRRIMMQAWADHVEGSVNPAVPSAEAPPEKKKLSEFLRLRPKA